MTMINVIVCCLLLLSSPVYAATLIWDQSNTGPLTVERGDTPTGPFAMVATVPSGTTQFILTPGAWGDYRVCGGACSNTVRYSSDLYSGFLTDRVDALEARWPRIVSEADVVGAAKLTCVESVTRSGDIDCYHALDTTAPAPEPAPASNFTVRIIDLDHIEITGTGCLSMATTGSGTRRVVECRH